MNTGSVGDSESKRPLGTAGFRLEFDIKMNLDEI
jgi:hypothetical protein